MKFTNEQSDGRHRVMSGRVLSAGVCPHGVGVHYPPGTSMCSPIHNLSGPHHIGFLWRFHCGHDSLNHWPLVVSSVSSSLPSLEDSLWGWKFRASKQGVAFLVTAPILKPSRVLPRVTSSEQKGSCHPHC